MARAKLLREKKRLCDYLWSSYWEYLKTPKERKGWLRVDRLLGEHGIPKDSDVGRAEFHKRMELRRASEDEDQWKSIERGWCLGSEEFRQELLAQMSEKAGVEHYGETNPRVIRTKAFRLLNSELKRLDWKERDLVQTRKGAPEKIKIALRLRRETTMTLDGLRNTCKWEPKHIYLICYIGADVEMEIVNDTQNRSLRPLYLLNNFTKAAANLYLSILKREWDRHTVAHTKKGMRDVICVGNIKPGARFPLVIKELL